MSWRIRQAGLADLAEAARMKAQAWVESYADLLPPDIVAGRTSAQAVARTASSFQREAERGAYFWIVVGEDGTVAGLAHACAARDADAPQPLELALIYLLEAAKGSGIADRLLEMAIGDAPAYLWVLSGNDRAQGFYRRHGFAPDGRTKPLDGRTKPLDGTPLVEERWVRGA